VTQQMKRKASGQNAKLDNNTGNIEPTCLRVTEYYVTFGE
jgi:hypothetical protein